MVVLILVVLWIVVLAPLYFRRWTDRGPVGSIDTFHRSLHLLGRGPKLVAPAYRLETAEPQHLTTGLPVISSSPRRPNLVLLKPVDQAVIGEDIVDDGAGGHYMRVMPTPSPSPAPAERPATVGVAGPTPEEYRRQLGRRRRRDTVAVLMVLTVLTGLIGLAPGFHALWVVTVLGLVALGAYAGLCVYAQSLQAAGSRPAGRPTAPAGEPYDQGWASPGPRVEYDERRVASR
jgi:hypothetical protein